MVLIYWQAIYGSVHICLFSGRGTSSQCVVGAVVVSFTVTAVTVPKESKENNKATTFSGASCGSTKANLSVAWFLEMSVVCNWHRN